MLIYLLVFYLEFQAGYRDGYNSSPKQDYFDKKAKDTDIEDRKKKSVGKKRKESKIVLFSAKNVVGRSGERVPLNIKIEGENLGLKTLLMIRGLPDKLQLSKGLKRHGIWSVPIADAGGVSIIVPDGFEGSFDVEYFLFKDPDSAPLKRVVYVVINPKP